MVDTPDALLKNVAKSRRRALRLRGRDIQRHIISSEASPSQKATLKAGGFTTTPRVTTKQPGGGGIVTGSAEIRALGHKRSQTTLNITPTKPRRFVAEAFGPGQTARTARHEITHQLLGQKTPKTSIPTHHRITREQERSNRLLSQLPKSVSVVRGRIATESLAPLARVGRLARGTVRVNPLAPRSAAEGVLVGGVRKKLRKRRLSSFQTPDRALRNR